jgi:hypothetical protein
MGENLERIWNEETMQPAIAEWLRLLSSDPEKASQHFEDNLYGPIEKLILIQYSKALKRFPASVGPYEDYRQKMLVHIVRYLPKYDPAKGESFPWVWGCVATRTLNLNRDYFTAKEYLLTDSESLTEGTLSDALEKFKPLAPPDDAETNDLREFFLSYWKANLTKHFRSEASRLVARYIVRTIEEGRDVLIKEMAAELGTYLKFVSYVFCKMRKITVKRYRAKQSFQSKG